MSYMTKDEAVEFFSEFYLGKHHIPRGGVKDFGVGWCVNHAGDLSTFDFDGLTRLVFLAHDRCVRVEVMHGGPRLVKIAIFKRDGRGGGIAHRHPTIETALADWRKRNPSSEAVGLDLVSHLSRQQNFSLRTFGPGKRTKGVIDHIRKELVEIEQQPEDLMEWIDVVLLAFDGALRQGYAPEGIAGALAAKLSKNEKRIWPDWRSQSPDQAICHVKSTEVV